MSVYIAFALCIIRNRETKCDFPREKIEKRGKKKKKLAHVRLFDWINKGN